jgi:opine dehydrogenase
MSDSNPNRTIAIVGAGIGGIYLVPPLAKAGARIRLHDIDAVKLAPIEAHGGIDVEGDEVAFAPVELATTDLRAAVSGAELVILVCGGTTHETLARALAPLVEDGQLILLIQGNTGGSLVVRRALRDGGCSADVDVAEMDNYPYSGFRLEATRIRPIVTKRWLQIASFPGTRTAAVMEKLSSLFPQAVAARDVLHTGLTNMNSILHVANCVANAALIERSADYRFYADGVTPAVARLYEAIDAERLAVARALGASVPSLAEWWEKVYGVREATLTEAAKRLTYDPRGAYQATDTPKTLQHKFILEDVPTGLIPTSALGSAAGVPTPAIDALVRVAGDMTGWTFASDARTLARLGLEGMDPARIRAIVENGFERERPA